jgi:hypothetical protein
VGVRVHIKVKGLESTKGHPCSSQKVFKVQVKVRAGIEGLGSVSENSCES